MHFSLKETSNDEILRLIRSGSKQRNMVISAIYQDDKLKNGIKKVIRNSNADNSIFEDIFNQTLVQFLKTVITKPDFRIQTNINSYLFGIAKFLWLKKLKSNKLNLEPYPTELDIKDQEVSIDLQIIETEKKDLLHKLLATMGKNCKEVLIQWASGIKMSEIAKTMGYASEVVARRKKFTCMQKLSAYMQDNPGLKSVFSS